MSAREGSEKGVSLEGQLFERLKKQIDKIQIEKVKEIEAYTTIESPLKDKDIENWLKKLEQLFSLADWSKIKGLIDSINMDEENKLKIFNDFHNIILEKVRKKPQEREEAAILPSSSILQPPQPQTAPSSPVEPAKSVEREKRQDSEIDSTRSVKGVEFEAFKGKLEAATKGTNPTFTIKQVKPDSFTLTPVGSLDSASVSIKREPQPNGRVSSIFPNEEAAKNASSLILKAYAESGLSPIEIKGSDPKIVQVMCNEALKIPDLAINLSKIARATLERSDEGKELLRQIEEKAKPTPPPKPEIR